MREEGEVSVEEEEPGEDLIVYWDKNEQHND